MTIVFFAVSILSSIVGSICGIGGGVIIKPVLDATGIMSVSSISFLSGCTVLAMSVVSVYKNVRAKTAKLNVRTATGLAVGAALGGLAYGPNDDTNLADNRLFSSNALNDDLRRPIDGMGQAVNLIKES